MNSEQLEARVAQLELLVVKQHHAINALIKHGHAYSAGLKSHKVEITNHREWFKRLHENCPILFEDPAEVKAFFLKQNSNN